MIHKKCQKQITAVAVFHSIQVAQYLFDNQTLAWVETNYPEDDIVSEYICGECGEGLDEREVGLFQTLSEL